MIVSVKRRPSFASFSQKPQAPVGKPSGVPFALQVPNDPFRAMDQLRVTLQAKQKIAPEQLLLYQLKAGELGMHVELVSKVGESVSASFRKLQQQG